MPFSTICRLLTFLAGALFLVLLLVPEVVFWLFGLLLNSEAAFISRRVSILFLGLSIMSWQMQNVQACSARAAFALGVSIMMAGLAVLGSIEFLLGNAGAGVLIAVITEALFFVLFFRYRTITS